MLRKKITIFFLIQDVGCSALSRHHKDSTCGSNLVTTLHWLLFVEDNLIMVGSND